MGKKHGHTHESMSDATVGTVEYTKTAIRCQIIGIITNVLLFGYKLFAGIVGKSQAMVSDALHTASDVVADFIAIVGLSVAKRKEDRRRPYGYEKVECIATLILGLILIYVAYEIGSKAVIGLWDYFVKGVRDAIPIPGRVALIAAFVSIVTKEALYRYVIHYAKTLNSPTLKATAWHHRSDSLSSIGALLGVGGAMLGLAFLDPIASVIICVIVFRVGLSVLRSSLQNLIETAMPYEDELAIYELVMTADGVETVNELKTRMFGPKYYVEITIGCAPSITLDQGHDIAEMVHTMIEAKFPEVKHVSVHVDPSDAEDHGHYTTFELPEKKKKEKTGSGKGR